MSEFTDLIAAVRALTAEIRELEVMTLPGQVQGLGATVAQLDTAAAGLAAQIEALTAADATHDAVLSGLTQVDNAQAAQITALYDADVALGGRLANLEAMPAAVSPITSQGIVTAPFTLTGTTADSPLYTLPLEAGSLAVGDELRVLVAGRMSGHRVKRMRVHIGGQQQFQIGLPSSARHPWNMEIMVVIRSVTEAVMVARLLAHTRMWYHTTKVVPIDPAAGVTIELTGELTRTTDTITCEVAVAHRLRHIV